MNSDFPDIKSLATSEEFRQWHRDAIAASLADEKHEETLHVGNAKISLRREGSELVMTTTSVQRTDISEALV